ncbi:MAG: uroporphyrinogen-III C-methyltransferase [Verrucomicrobia bacterium]|nr:MAG: uroporphyrinogen-III C-methyltransferase [Verrucomicrobiota bacterium]PYJ43069.1 MAG: uroporphyrinogen-III C-methyltransferase [Verrucomicrobiota bacterium]PYL52952.1 MAG: uroporphyrinogen-III C-methyltransferase [Verrucomicrobiota bacterium]
MPKSTKQNGTVYLVGGGPGDLGLVTLRAKECIENADVIVYDHLANPELLRWARDDAEIIYAGKEPGESRTQQEINTLLIDKAREGKQVVRLKGGDPFVFGRGAEEAEAIAEAGIPFEIVPGITSATAGPAYAGIPMTHRKHNSHVTFFTGHEDPAKQGNAVDYAALAKLGGTQVMLMGVERLGAITNEMLKQGVRADLPVALVRSATTGQQETLTGTLSDIAQKAVASDFKAPAVAVFGEVVALRHNLNWYEKRPLLGKRILVTRIRKQASVLSNKLRALGAHVIELPTIRIEPPSDLREFAELVQDAHVYDWIVFTSANGVEAFFDIFFKLYYDAREIGAVRIAAIGPATAQRVKDFHLHVDLQPDEFVAEAVVKEFEKQGSIENLRILLVRAEKTRDTLPKELSALGAIVDKAFAYRTVPETRDTSGARRQLAQDGADLITFTSSSTVENFLALGLPWPKGMRIASIGPITSKTARDHGLTVDVEARRHDIDGLAQAIREFFEKS